jgi:type IV pilus biogenesis protein PilP
MKTVFEHIGVAGVLLAVLTVLIGTLEHASHPVLAAGIVLPAPTYPPMSGPPGAPATAPTSATTALQQPTAPSTPMTATSNNPSMPVMPAGSTTPDADIDGGSSGKGKDVSRDDKAKSDKKLAVLEDKVSDSVKDVAKRLGTTTENVTLDDLNSARQAVAKLEALIDIEKHLSDLDKIRSERENNGTSRGLAAAIPASALAPLPMQMGTPFPSMATASISPPTPSLMPISAIEVTRILGSDGHFVALMKTPDGQSKPVHVGDHLSDGSSVSGITSKGVVLDENGSKHVIPVKNIDTIFGNPR